MASENYRTADETVFLTGFPGFIAERLVRRLAAEGARFLLLVQPQFVARAQAEVGRIASHGSAPLTASALLKVTLRRAILGSIVQTLKHLRERPPRSFTLPLFMIWLCRAIRQCASTSKARAM